MILKDYPEEVFNTTQQLLIQLQQLPDIPLSSSSAESFAPEHGVFESPKGTEGSSASAAATEHEVFVSEKLNFSPEISDSERATFEIKKKRKPMNIKEAQYSRETFYY